MTLLSIKDLSVDVSGSPRRRIVNHVSLHVDPGETVALVGESGSGKSITALSILRLLPSALQIVSGKIEFEGLNLLGLSESTMRDHRGRGISMIFQEPMTSLNPVVTIEKQICEVILRHSRSSRLEARRRALQLLEQVGLPDPQRNLGSYPHQLSGGMRQRVMIAIALAVEPRLLIADEPTTALDVTIQAQVLDLLAELQQTHKMAVLFITHDLGLVQQVADRVLVMRQGELLETAPQEEFFANPQHAYSRELLASVPSIAKRGTRIALPNASSQSVQEKPVKGVAKMQSGENPILEVSDLKVYFPIRKGVFRKTVGYVKAVDGVSFQMNRGETVALVGESGSGKTTVGKGIVKLLDISAGTVRFKGTPMQQLSGESLRRQRRHLQIVFQDPFSSMNPRLRVRDIMLEGLKAQQLPGSRQDHADKITYLLDRVGLPADAVDRYPHEFSGGQRQRICIARALALEPDVLVCDEPTSALDVTVQAQVLNLLLDLQEEFGLSYLFITHNMSVVSYLADQILVMYQGNIVEQGNALDVLQHPQHAYTKKLLASVPQLEL